MSEMAILRQLQRFTQEGLGAILGSLPQIRPGHTREGQNHLYRMRESPFCRAPLVRL
jgi:hypothetical protein